MNTYTLDATDKKLGRLASEVSVLLMGKQNPDFARNKPGMDKVVIVNASKLSIAPEKMKKKTYIRYSGYPRGIHERTMEKVIEKFDLKTVIERAVYRMLPANRLRGDRMRRLMIQETK